MTDKKLTDVELENATGAGPSISSQKTENRGTYGTGQVEQGEGSGETEPNPLPDSKLGQVRGGVNTAPGGGVSSEQTGEMGALGGAAEGRRTDGHGVQKDG